MFIDTDEPALVHTVHREARILAGRRRARLAGLLLGTTPWPAPRRVVTALTITKTLAPLLYGLPRDAAWLASFHVGAPACAGRPLLPPKDGRVGATVLVWPQVSTGAPSQPRRAPKGDRV